MKELAGWQKQHLRSLAHHLKPVIQIGRQGVSDSLIAAVNKALDDHELIKIKFHDFKDEKDDLSQKIAELCHADIAGKIGNMIILFRQNSDKEKRKIILPRRKTPAHTADIE